MALYPTRTTTSEEEAADALSSLYGAPPDARTPQTTDEFWKEVATELQAGNMTPAGAAGEFIPLVPQSQIPSFEEWYTPEVQAYFDYVANKDMTGPTANILLPEEQALAEAAGIDPSTAGSGPEAAYVSQFYEAPSKDLDFMAQWGPTLAAAGMGALAYGASAAVAGGSEIGGAAALEGAAPVFGGEAIAGSTALEGAAPLLGAEVVAPTGTALGTGAAAGTATETAIADLVATGMTPEAAAAAVASGGAAIPAVTGTTTSLIPGVSNQVLSGVAQGAAGVIGADITADAYEDVSQDLLALGDPYRDLLEASYAPDFNLFDQPGYAESLDQLADITTRQYSATSGNPANNPGISGDIYNSVLQTAYLPALESYQSGLAAAGGLGVQPASQAMMAIPPTNASLYNAIGYGVGTALAPPNPYDELMKSMTNYYNTIGGVKV